ncbi:MAG: hypothetical protein Q7T41_03710 [Candidatus Saccharibacteria bacterium]|nr:hypothetical protein [Candidatus Saccharibacteria bacterium]
MIRLDQPKMHEVFSILYPDPHLDCPRYGNIRSAQLKMAGLVDASDRVILADPRSVNAMYFNFFGRIITDLKKQQMTFTYEYTGSLLRGVSVEVGLGQFEEFDTDPFRRMVVIADKRGQSLELVNPLKPEIPVEIDMSPEAIEQIFPVFDFMIASQLKNLYLQ